MEPGPTAPLGRINPRRATLSAHACSCFRVGVNVERGPEPIREQRRANCCICCRDSESECAENPPGAPGGRAAATPRASDASTARHYRACSSGAGVRCEQLGGRRKPRGPVTTRNAGVATSPGLFSRMPMFKWRGFADEAAVVRSSEQPLRHPPMPRLRTSSCHRLPQRSVPPVSPHFLFVLRIMDSSMSHCSSLTTESALNSPASAADSPPSKCTISPDIQLA